tara:strand:+ start:16 stop:369 length:354 start_codon:yes stop_codon:yes gene_type:complete
MSTKNVVFNKLFKPKTKLSKKVALSIINDLNSEYENITSSTNEIIDGGSEVSAAMFNLKLDFRDLLNKYSTIDYIGLLSDYENAANELGLDIDEKYNTAFDEFLSAKRYWADEFEIR